MNVLLLLYTYIDGNIGGTNMRIGESFIPGGVTHTLGRNDRGVTPTGESFIPLTWVHKKSAFKNQLTKTKMNITYQPKAKWL